MKKLLLIMMIALILPSSALASRGWLDRGSNSGHNTFTGSAMDDPIVFPGSPGASHMHDFFCTRPDAFSTYESMQAQTSTCPNDNAGYWTPALYKNGAKIDPIGPVVREQIYYLENVSTVYRVNAFPPGFKMVVGNSHATTQTEANAINPNSGIGAKIPSEQYWGCSNNSPDTKNVTPINCSTGIISLHVGFPNCWNGVQVAGDQIAAGTMRWPSGSSCPAGFGYVLPRVIERFEYAVGTDSSGISLASGNVYSVHADFWNTWNQNNLQTFVDRCLNGNIDCGTNPTP